MEIYKMSGTDSIVQQLDSLGCPVQVIQEEPSNAKPEVIIGIDDEGNNYLAYSKYVGTNISGNIMTYFNYMKSKNENAKYLVYRRETSDPYIQLARERPCYLIYVS
jgi:hypothetical protein